MSQANIEYLKNKNGQTISPVTSTDSVFDSNNKTVTTRLNEIDAEIGDIVTLMSQL